MRENWQELLLNEWQNRITIKENRVVFKGLCEQAIVIPSTMFPLKDKKYTIFCEYNTEDFETGSEQEEKAIRAFDRVESKIGRCYNNSKMLIEELRKEGIDSKSYVGWLFVGTELLPLHHCFVVVDDNKILDYGISLKASDYEDFKKNRKEFTVEETRNQVLERFKEKLSLPNHERFGFGKAERGYYYVACECDADEGLRNYNSLLKMYPNHITFIKPRGKGNETVMQQMIKQLGDY